MALITFSCIVASQCMEVYNPKGWIVFFLHGDFEKKAELTIDLKTLSGNCNLYAKKCKSNRIHDCKLNLNEILNDTNHSILG